MGVGRSNSRSPRLFSCWSSHFFIYSSFFFNRAHFSLRLRKCRRARSTRAPSTGTPPRTTWFGRLSCGLIPLPTHTNNTTHTHTRSRAKTTHYSLTHSITHIPTHAPTHPRTHAPTHARTHARTHTHVHVHVTGDRAGQRLVPSSHQ
jgi:hypothetical protein